MEQLLFSVLLDQAATWVGERVANIFCTRCKTTSRKPVVNQDSNLLRCPHCGNQLDQFVNAHPYTINSDRTVAGAGVHGVRCHVDRPDAVGLSNTLVTINALKQHLVVFGRFGAVDDHRPFFTSRTLAHYPKSVLDRTRNWWVIPFETIPKRDTLIDVDLVVLNQRDVPLAYYHDRLDTITLLAKLVKLKKSMDARYARLVQELCQLEEEHRQFEQCYREIVLHLTGRLPRH